MNIRGPTRPEIERAIAVRETVHDVIQQLLQLLHPLDFEILVDQVCSRSRQRVIGRTQKTPDLQPVIPSKAELAALVLDAGLLNWLINKVSSAPTFALVTPSYAPDFERCRLLAESVLEYTPANVPHYIIVERRDRRLFSQLASSRTHIAVVEDAIPPWLLRAPTARRWWLSLRTRPVRNWMMQQIVKLSANAVATEDVLIFADSDTFLVKRYDPAAAVRGDRVPLFREHGEQLRTDFGLRWRQVASTLLGLPRVEDSLTSHVGMLITWRRRNLERLHSHIEQVHGRSWVEAVCVQPSLSEYCLYGTFCEEVLGSRSGHYFDSTINTLNYWPDEPLDDVGLGKLRARLRPEHVGVMISAKSRTPMKAIHGVFKDRVEVGTVA
jgi:hypothetical protein